MKHLILALIFATSNVYAWKDTGQYERHGDKKERIAKIRAAQHPKGSGIGTNRYNVTYDKSYRVEKYRRIYKD